MISKNYKVLEIRDNHEYVFDSFAFKASVRKFVADKKSSGEQFSMELAKSELAEKMFTSVDSINNWMYGRNGVSDIETVKKLASYLKIEYEKLLRIQENKTMIDNKDINTNFNFDMEKTKDVIRNVYQKMSIFMDIADECVLYDYTPESFKEYEHYYLDAKRVLHLSMLDIPTDIYIKLESILSTFAFYLYGFDGDSYPFDIWDTCDYSDFLEDNHYENNFKSQQIFMSRESDKFYKEIREILKDYITV